MKTEYVFRLANGTGKQFLETHDTPIDAHVRGWELCQELEVDVLFAPNYPGAFWDKAIYNYQPDRPSSNIHA